MSKAITHRWGEPNMNASLFSFIDGSIFHYMVVIYAGVALHDTFVWDTQPKTWFDMG